jgi:hypothetical protein
MPHVFLSDDWFAAAEQLRDQAPEPTGAAKDLVLNVVVEGGPDGDVPMRMDKGKMERGLADAAPTTLRLPYDLAKRMFIDGDASAGMQGFMSGQIKVQGDMTKLMALQSAGGPTAEQRAFQEKLQEITA